MRSALKSKSNLLRLLATFLAVALIVYLLEQQGWDEIWAVVQGIATWRLAAAMLLMFLSRGFVILRWHNLLVSGGVPATWQQSTRITFAGLFANNFLPSTVGGDVARLGGALQVGFDAAISAASLVVDRLVGMAGMALAMPVGLWRLFAAGLSLPSSAFLLVALAEENAWGRFWKRVRALFLRLVDAMKLWLGQPRALFISLLYTLGHMLCFFTGMAILLQGMGDPLPLWLIAGLWSMVYLITLVPFTINAFGLQELSVAFAFTQLGGVSPASSAALALLWRTLQLLASLPGALFLSDILPGINRARPLLGKLDS